MAERAGAGDLDHHVGVRSERQQLGQFMPRLLRRRRRHGLLQPEVIDHQGRVGVALGEQAHLLQPAARHQVDRQVVFGGGRQHAVDAGIGRIRRNLRREHDADGDGAVHRRPCRDRVLDLGIVGIHGLDDAEAAGMCLLDSDGIALVPTVHRIDGDQQRTIDADGVHGLDHVGRRHLRRTGEHRCPRAAGMIALVAVNLGVDCRHAVWPPTHWLSKLWCCRGAIKSRCVGVRHTAQ